MPKRVDRANSFDLLVTFKLIAGLSPEHHSPIYQCLFHCYILDLLNRTTRKISAEHHQIGTFSLICPNLRPTVFSLDGACARLSAPPVFHRLELLNDCTSSCLLDKLVIPRFYFLFRMKYQINRLIPSCTHYSE